MIHITNQIFSLYKINMYISHAEVNSELFNLRQNQLDIQAIYRKEKIMQLTILFYWLKNEDRNMAFFHKTAKLWKYQNHIYSVTWKNRW